MTDKHPDPVIIETNANPTAAIIWLHGLGADGFDFVSIVDQLKLPKDMAIRFIFPHAPEQAVTLNQGMFMRAWFDILGLDRNSKQDVTGIQTADKNIQALIAEQIAQGIPAYKIILAGFSQGGAMALHTGLRYPEKLAGIMGISTYLPVADHLATEKHSANDATSILIAHGTEDAVLPLSYAESTKEYLSNLNYHIDWHIYPGLEHSVCLEEINDISKWIQAKLK